MPEKEERANEETVITPGIDVAKLKKKDNKIGKNKKKTTAL